MAFFRTWDGVLARLLRAGAMALPFVILALAHPALREVSPLAVVEASTLDWRYHMRGTRDPDAPVAIVAIDDHSVRALGGWPVSRGVLGKAVTRLSAAGARTIAIDLLLAEPARVPGADPILAAALEDSRRALLPVAFTFAEGTAASGRVPDVSAHAVPLLQSADTAMLPRPTGALAPVPQLAETAADLGHVNVVFGHDGAVRQLDPALTSEGAALPALPLAAVRLFRGLPRDAVTVDLTDAVRLGRDRIALDSDGRWTLDFYGRRGSFPTYSLDAVVRGDVPAEAVAGRIVWIGATATAVGDTFLTPFDPALPGVELFATATANLLKDAFLRRDEVTTVVDMAGIMAVGLLTLRGALLVPVWLAILALPLPLVAWFTFAATAFTAWGVWLNLTLPALAGTGAAAAVGVWRLLLGDAQRRRLAAYVPRRLAAALAKEERPAFEGRDQMAAVLFVDMAGFTARSEAGAPGATVALLRPLHAAFEECASKHDGYVDSFMGDGAMLVFGVPEPTPRDAVNALACARTLLERAGTLGLEIRVGVHYGEVRIARLGGHRQHQITVAGDTVNVASRLMDLAKEHGGTLALTNVVAEVVRRVGKEDLLSGLHRYSDQPLRGRTARVDVWLGNGAPQG